MDAVIFLLADPVKSIHQYIPSNVSAEDKSKIVDKAITFRIPNEGESRADIENALETTGSCKAYYITIPYEGEYNDWVKKYPYARGVVFYIGYGSREEIYLRSISHIFRTAKWVYHGDYNEPQVMASYENMYRHMMRAIILAGDVVEGRNGLVRSTTGARLVCNLEEEFPILTCRKVPWRHIVEEALWMLRGQTDAKILSAKGVKAWEGNTTRKFLDERGLTHLQEGDIGPGYGWQMRHYGAKYEGAAENPANRGEDASSVGGVDQWARVIDILQKDPMSRRAIINLWNPAQNDEMALPPCHTMYKFTVREYKVGEGDGVRTVRKLNCEFVMRSWDMTLGWNMPTAALFTHILARICGFGVGMLKMFAMDAHIYEEHIHALQEEYLSRVPYLAPRLEIAEDAKLEDIWSLRAEDFVLKDYVAHPAIKFEMKV